MEKIEIGGEVIGPGEEKYLDFRVARLPTGTVIDMPVLVSRGNEPGPGLLLVAGMHGDEINGVEILRRVVARKHYKVDKGTVICIPILNLFGFINFSREVTDGKDVNRSFPGSKKGSLASQMARIMMDEILPHIDYGIDLHTGGRSINNYPQIRAVMEDEVNLELAKAFGPPFIVNARFRDKSLRKEAYKLDKRILVYEAGESLRLRKNVIDIGMTGIQRIMHHLGMISQAPDNNITGIRVNKTSWVRARRSGMYHSFPKNGTKVKKGEVIGLISEPFGNYEHRIKTTYSGYIIAVNNNPVVNRGDALIHIGIE